MEFHDAPFVLHIDMGRVIYITLEQNTRIRKWLGCLNSQENCLNYSLTIINVFYEIF